MDKMLGFGEIQEILRSILISEYGLDDIDANVAWKYAFATDGLVAEEDVRNDVSLAMKGRPPRSGYARLLVGIIR